MSVILKQFDGGAIAPRDDAILYNSIITRNGILNGCTITHLGANQIKITAGRGIIKGRMFEVEEMTVNCQLASAGTQKGRMYLRMELSNMENPAQIKTVAADTLPELVQEEDCNYTNGIYELELCTYDVTDTLLSNLKTTYEVIDTVFPVAKTLDDVNGVTDEDVLAGALAVKELSSELYQSVSNTDSMTLIDAIGHICDNYITSNGSGRGRFKCVDGWYAYDIIKAGDSGCTGYLNNSRDLTAYTFKRLVGADAVLKKLGDTTFEEIVSTTASGEIECFDYTFTESKRLFVITMAVYNSTPFDLSLHISGTADYNICATWKSAPFLFNIVQVDGTPGQTITMKSVAYIQNQHTVRSYMIE